MRLGKWVIITINERKITGRVYRQHSPSHLFEAAAVMSEIAQLFVANNVAEPLSSEIKAA